MPVSDTQNILREYFCSHPIGKYTQSLARRAGGREDRRQFGARLAADRNTTRSNCVQRLKKGTCRILKENTLIKHDTHTRRERGHRECSGDIPAAGQKRKAFCCTSCTFLRLNEARRARSQYTLRTHLLELVNLMAFLSAQKECIEQFSFSRQKGRENR